MESSFNRPAFAALIYSRIVTGITWWNLSSVFPLIAADLSVGVSALGLVTGVFVFGFGILQIPGALVGKKLGARRTMVYGIFASSIASLLTGLAPEFYSIVALRLIVGLGQALAFSSSMTIMVSTFRRGSEGVSIGLFNSSVSVGLVIGIFGWAVLGEFIGWRLSLVLSGALGVIAGILLFLHLPREEEERTEVRLSGILKLARDRWLIAVSGAMLAIQIGVVLENNFMVYYLRGVLGASPAVAGLVASLGSILSLISAPFFGRAHDRLKRTRHLLLILGLDACAGVVFASLNNLLGAILCGIAVGIAQGGGFTIGFAGVRESARGTVGDDGLRIGFANTAAVFGTSWVPIAFSLLVVTLGYQASWIAGGAFVLIFLAPLLLVRRRADAEPSTVPR